MNEPFAELLTPKYDVIAAWLVQWEMHFVEPVVFGTEEPEQIARLLSNFCRVELSSPVAEYLFYASSLGAVCGVRLRDGRRVIVKAHQPNQSLDFLRAVVDIQRYLYEQGYPCPQPLLDPRPLALGLATVEALVDEGEYRQSFDPAIRRSMAEMLARLIGFTKTYAGQPGVDLSALDARLPEGVTWPIPHSQLFDFAATASGAEWIDEIARRSQTIKLHGAGDLVVGHIDWGIKHFRYVGELVRVIYDWDSLTLEKEPIIVGHAAGYFTYTEFFDTNRKPTAEESQAFVSEYEAARGRPFTAAEHETLNAAKVYSLAYGARCEHALDPHTTTFLEDSCRAKLAHYRI